MSEYIWYIVGGISLFFIIIGFVADKSGLAKKTFSKNSETKKSPSNNEQLNLNKIELTNDGMNVELQKDNGINISETSMIQDSLNYDDINIVEPVINEDTQVIDEFLGVNNDDVTSFEDNKQIEQVIDIDEVNLSADESPLVNEIEEEVTSNSLYLNNGETDASYDDLDKAYLEVEEPVEVQNENSESVWEQENDINLVENQDYNVSQEDWKIEPEEKIEESNQDLENIELPSLDDLNIGDEDVWKF